MRVPRSLIFAAATLVSACDGKADPSPEEEAKTPPPARSTQEMREAHTASLQRGLELTEPVLLAARPRVAWMTNRGGLRPTPLTPLPLSTAMKKHPAADREISEIDGGYLEDKDAVRHMAAQHALHQVEVWAQGRTSTRTDPLAGIHEANAFLDEVDRMIVTNAEGDPAQALVALGEAMGKYYADLGAASASSLDAAIADFEVLIGRVQRLETRVPAVADASRSLRSGLEALRTQLRSQRDALPPEPNAVWIDLPTAAMGRPTLRRLPDAMGTAELARRLQIDERLTRNVAEAVPQLFKVAERLDKIRAQTKADHGDVVPSAPSPVTAQRCAAAVQTILEGMKAQDQAPWVECEALVELWGPVELTDGAVMYRVNEELFLDEAARKLRLESPAWLALQTGRMVPASHRRFVSVTVAQNVGDPQFVLEATDRMQDAICLATSAVFVHAEIPQQDKLRQWLATDCATRPAEAWINEATARPIASLDGVGLTLVSSGPAGAMMLAAAPWAPLGLVPAYADPKREQPRRPFEVQSIDAFLAEDDKK